MKLVSLKRLSILFILFAIAIGYMSTNWESPTVVKAQSQDPLLYPVLLVHGLGEGPGDEAFGNLQKYLEDYYFDVIVVDFNEFSGNKLAKDKDAGNLGTLAALLGIKIKSVLKEYDVTQVNIVAHSYGGLIVQAYLLNYGEAYSKKYGGYADDVHKVVYIQTPFYGTMLDEASLTDLVSYTDYGVYTNAKKIMESLQLGSQEIFDMHNDLQKENIYEQGIDAITLVSRDDEVVSEESATLSTFMEKDDYQDVGRFKIFDNYSHSAYSADPTSNNGSLAYVKNITDPNFIEIASFLDSGSTWKKIGDDVLQENSMLMLYYEKLAGFNKLGGDEVKLSLEKKYTSNTKPKNRLAVNDELPVFFNNKSRVFVFTDLTPGEYKLSVENSKNKEPVEKQIKYLANFQPVVDGYIYDPKQNILMKGDSAIRGDCLYYVEEATITGLATRQAPLPGLNTNGFEIEFEVSNVNLALINKGVLVSLHNANGSMDSYGRANGGRIGIVVRGSAADNAIHAGKIMLNIVVDKNRNGYLDDAAGEFEEYKDGQFNWLATNKIKLRVQTQPDGQVKATIFVNDAVIFSVEKSKPYWNPNPIISIGGYIIADDYRPPVGAIIRQLCVTNIKE